MSGLKDKRRNLGPTDQIDFVIPDEKEVEPPSDKLRPVFVSQGIAMHATGSAYMEVGELKLHATIHGPQQARGEFSDKAEIEVNVQIQKFAGIDNHEDVSQALSDYIRSSITPAIVLKEYPKSRIVVSLSIINGANSAAQTAAAVNAVTMALVNAGIALHDMVTAVAVSKFGNKFYVDQDFAEETPNLKQIVTSWSVSTRKLVGMLVTSHVEVSKEDLRELLSRAGTASVQLRELFNAFLVEDYSNSTKPTLELGSK